MGCCSHRWPLGGQQDFHKPQAPTLKPPTPGTGGLRAWRTSTHFLLLWEGSGMDGAAEGSEGFAPAHSAWGSACGGSLGNPWESLGRGRTKTKEETLKLQQEMRQDFK